MVARLAIKSERTNVNLSSAQPTSELMRTSLIDEYDNGNNELATARRNGIIEERNIAQPGIQKDEGFQRVSTGMPEVDDCELNIKS